jgi:hypothetical protein
MSDDRPAASGVADAPPVLPQHYQILCGLALGVLFLVQVQQGLLLTNLAMLLMGVLAIVLRIRLSPLLVLLPLVGGQFYLQVVFRVWHTQAVLQPEDVLLCAAALGYVAGHYRLLALWGSILPADPRQRYHAQAPVVVPLGRLGKVAPQHRPAALLSRGEIAWFVLQLPLFALLAQGAWVLLGIRREVLDLTPRWMQFVSLAWALALGLFVAGQFFRYWRLLQMDRVTATMLLQDVLWHETRGEQRRIARWLAWERLRRKSETRNPKSETNPKHEM